MLFAAMFDTIWVLSETLVGDLLMICGVNIEKVQVLGSVTSKILFLMIIGALKRYLQMKRL